MILKHRFTRFVGVALVVGLILSGALWAWGQRDYWFLNNFRVVEPERIYAGGYQYPRPLKRLLDDYHIKTVLSLRGPDGPQEREELAVLAAAGVKFQRVAIPVHSTDEEKLPSLAEALAVLNDPENQPVFVHCWAGCHRSGIVVAAYRVSCCGWTEEAARAELVRWGGTERGQRWPARLLHVYCLKNRATLAADRPTKSLR